MRAKQSLSCFPLGRISALAQTAGPFAPQLETFAGLYPLARMALYWGIVSLRLKPGTVAWAPSFHCGVEVQAMLEAGCDVRFYRVHSDLTVDEEDLISKVEKNPGPVLLVHYFGFPQPATAWIASVCLHRGWPLIEDCAHALFSGDGVRKLGHYAPMAVYSLRKTLPMYEGGALRIGASAQNAAFRPPLRPRSRSIYLAYLRSELGQALGSARIANIRRMLGQGYSEASSHSELELGPLREQAISPISERLARKADPETIILRRRRNYEALDKALKQYEGYSAVFDGLSPEVCPLCLPIRVSRRGDLVKDLYKNDIIPYLFGAYFHPVTPPEMVDDAAPLRDSILCLPVHQMLEARDLERLASVIGPLLKAHMWAESWQTTTV